MYKFNIGDLVVGNELSERYGVTNHKRGFIGRVTDRDEQEITTLTLHTDDGDNIGMEWDGLDVRCFDKATKETVFEMYLNENITKEQYEKLIGEINDETHTA